MIKLHTNTSWDCASLIRTCTKSKNEKITCNPKINYRSQRKLKFSLAMLLFGASTFIFVIKGLYYSITHFMTNNILIHFIFAFLNNMFLYFYKHLTQLLKLKVFLKWMKENAYIIWGKKPILQLVLKPK